MNQNEANEIEARKDRFDLRPSLEFVDKHLQIYRANMELFWNREKRVLPPSLSTLEYKNTDKLDKRHPDEPQVSMWQIMSILIRLPPSFLELSLLKTVDYEHNRSVPIPIFDPEGNWTKNVTMLSVDEFPGSHHPSRILIGYSNGKVVFPTALPASVSERYETRWFYQAHFFLHELFHTIELPRRKTPDREAINLTRVAEKSKVYTFETWWQSWAADFALMQRTTYVSRYAATYAGDLTSQAYHEDSEVFTAALAEQICEAFVGYMLGILPNDRDSTSFREAWPEDWRRIDQLVNSKIVRP